MRWFGSLQSRMLMLVVLVTLPALGALWLVSDAHHNEGRAHAEVQAATAVQAAATEQRRLMVSTQRLMRTLTESTALAFDHLDACNHLLGVFQNEYPGMTGLRVVDAEGAHWCGGGQHEVRIPVLDAALQWASSENRFVVTPAAIDEDGVARFGLGHPFESRNHTTGIVTRRYLLAAVELRFFDFLRSFIEGITPQVRGEDSVLLMAGSGGVGLWRSPAHPDFPLGRADERLIRAESEARAQRVVGDNTPAFLDTIGPDGIRRYYAAVLVTLDEGTGSEHLLISGVPAATFYGPAATARRQGLLFMALTVVLVSLVALATAKFLMRHDIKPLLDLTHQFARGRIPDDPGTYNGPVEFVALRDAMISSARAQRDSEHRLQGALQKLDTYFRNSPMAFLELDESFRVRQWTPQAEAVFGWTEEEVLGRTPLEFGMVLKDDEANVSAVLDRALREGGYIVNHNRNCTKDGRVIACEWHNSVILGKDGEIESMLCIALDETQRLEAERALVQREREYRLVFAHNPAPMWIYDLNSLRFLAVNAAAIRHYGWTEQEFLAMTLRDIRPPEETARLEKYLSDPSNSLRNAGLWVHRRKDGGEMLVEVASDNIHWEGRMARIVVAHDVTGREQARAALEMLTQDLEQRVADRTLELETANRELEAYSYTVSHDLRGPLRSLDGFSQMLMEDYGDQLPAEAASHLQRIRAAALRMGALIDDLLTLSRVTRGMLNPQDIDLSAMVRSIAEELRQQEPSRNVRLVSPEGMRIHGDAGLVRVAMTNLLGNAWKFTIGRDPARIEVGVVQEADGPVYYVKDNGIGFDMKYAEKLFGVFERLHQDSDIPGTGIGLATVKRIIDRHGGRIWAEGRPGDGATFRFVLHGRKVDGR